MFLQKNWDRIFALATLGMDVALAFFNTQIVWWFIYRIIGRSIPLYQTWQQRWLIPMIFIAIMSLQRSSTRAFKQQLSDQFLSLCRVAAYGLLASVLLVFATEGFLYSRSIIFSYFLLAPGVILAGRWLLHVMNRPFLRRGWGLQHSIIIGTGAEAQRIIDHLILNKAIGYHIVGCLAESPDGLNFRYRGVRAVGLLSEFNGKLEGRQIDQVFIPGLIHEIERYQPVIDLCRELGINLRLVSHQVDILLRAAHIWDVAGVSLINLRDKSSGRFGRQAKRIADVFISGMILLLLSPLLALVSLLIALDSKGGVFYRQKRVGINGRHFYILKFRTMRDASDDDKRMLAEFNEVEGPIFKMKKDPRVTAIGWWLRRFSIDELPQLVNVLKGEMSLVGPRPALPEEVEKYHPWHHHRYRGPQGLTGLWQISGRSELSFDEMVLLDIYYLENWSFLLDIDIMLKTIPVVLMGRGAY
jgi:exopolysaccharide biosynthesis polyprenyl glycosylphosphotransferase